ncbi:MAG: hypothetical protein JNL38_33250 [Myxococcales bacterium]|jgi:hypothetical protein|nr:hypothetical protein [Myxococcales bacterium]
MRSLVVSLAVVALVAGCKPGASTSDAGAPAASSSPAASGKGAASAASAPITQPESDGGMSGGTEALSATRAEKTKIRARSAAGKAGEVVDVAGGPYLAGATPGEEGREPATEPALTQVDLGAFQIDALPFPNDPKKPAKLVASVGEADRACREAGARLCTEVEWERACKGPDGDAYATGTGWDPECDKDAASCESGYRARAMGAAREWVVGAIASEGGGAGQVLRGGPTSSAPGKSAFYNHRCSRRGREDGGGGAAFRCCRGAENKATLPAVAALPAFRKVKMEADKLGKILQSIPELGRISGDVRSFEGEVGVVTSRSHASAEGVSFTGSPVLWSPELGVEVFVATGRTKNLSFVVALYPLPNDKYKLASYFLMLGDVAPVALAYNPSHRKELFWSSCWGCSGEQGAVSIRDDHHVVVVQH